MVMCLLFQFISWSLYALRLVCLCPLHGHPQPVCWATVAHSVGNECPNIEFVLGNIL